jgi:phospholipase C
MPYGTEAMNRSELRSNVDTIVVVMMENRSFDHVLGFLSHPGQGNRAGVLGIDDLAKPAYANPNSDGEGIAPFWMSDGPIDSDLPHGPEAVQTQLSRSLVNGSYLMNGFVKAFENEFHTSLDQPPVMGLLRAQDLPTTSALAAQYTVCDNWFACLPTSTAPNRLMSMCGFTNHRDTGTLLPDQTTIYDWLLAHGVRWRVYSAGLPFFLLMPRLAPLLLTTHFRDLDDLPTDLLGDAADEWPQVIFIEPDYHDCPIHLRAPCDNHPPLAMAPGEAFLGQVYRWLTSNPARWAKTALLITYDEHGGFFDHIAPALVKYRNPNGVAFDTTGPRVPVIVAGPYAQQRGVSHALLDNTSILQLFAERFGQPGETYSPEVLGRMQQKIVSVSAVLSATAGNLGGAALGGAAASPAPAPTLAGSANLRQAFTNAAQSFVAAHQAEALAKYPALAPYAGK